MLALLGAGPVITQVTPPMRCPAGKVLVRADFKTCPTEHRRRARTVRRACCQGESGKVHLHALSPLPEPLSRVTSEM